MVMVRLFLLVMMLACMPSGVNAAPEESAPSVRACLHSVCVWNGGRWFQEEEDVPHLTVDLLFRCAAPWKVSCMNWKKTRLALSDSYGNRAPQARWHYGSSSESRWPLLISQPWLSVDGNGWIPHRKSRWVEISGTAAVLVSSVEKVTEEVTIQLKKGAKVPVLFRDALPPGKEGDVQTELTVSDVARVAQRDDQSIMWVTVSMELPDGCGVRKLEMAEEKCLVGSADVPLLPNPGRGGGRFVWIGAFYVKKLREGDWMKAKVRYASGLKEVAVPVSFRVGLWGMDVQDGKREKESTGKEER